MRLAFQAFLFWFSVFGPPFLNRFLIRVYYLKGKDIVFSVKDKDFITESVKPICKNMTKKIGLTLRISDFYIQILNSHFRAYLSKFLGKTQRLLSFPRKRVRKSLRYRGVNLQKSRASLAASYFLRRCLDKIAVFCVRTNL